MRLFAAIRRDCARANNVIQPALRGDVDAGSVDAQAAGTFPAKNICRRFKESR
jgi:hypothetical protein